MQFEVKAKYDVIIIGSGISGLICAIELSKNNKSVCIVTKEAITESSSLYAQGGIAIPLDESDSIEKHIEDTLKAGTKLCDYNVAKKIISSSREAFEKLLSYGVKFDLKAGNLVDLTKEAAHSFPRVCHVGGDASGRFITKTLIDKVCRDQNISISQGTSVLSLLKDKDIVTGVLVEDITKDKYVLSTRDVIIASGGAGQLFSSTTNPKVSTGDGLAMAYRAGASLQDVEMIQFHPTVLIQEAKEPLLITEAIRGEGAKLKNINGQYFAKNYHENAELAPRDVLSRGILREMNKTKSKFVYLDLTNFKEEYFKNRFPTIFQSCIERGIDLFKEGIPVSPAAHYLIGGVKVSLSGRTSISNLWVVGEAASNGFHGANRLASNSLLECIVVPHFLVSELISSKKNDFLIQDSVEVDCDKSSYNEAHINDVLKDLQSKNLFSLGLVRNEQSLKSHLNYLELLLKEYSVDLLSMNSHVQEFKNMVYLSYLICNASLRRNESLGAHFREDYQNPPKVFSHSVFLPNNNFLFEEEISQKSLV